MGLFKVLFGVSNLLGAIESGDKEKAKNLILQGADVNQKVRLTGATPLFAACIRNYQDIAELLLSRGADVNAPLSVGTTTLHYIAEYLDNRSLDMVSFLLSKGAKIDTEDCDGRSPLHSACKNKDHSIAELLILSGADIHKRVRQGATPLHFAVNAGNAVLVRLLLDKGANVNDAKNIEGASPLHVAAENGDAEITKLLLSKHADISAKDKNGRTPLQIAESICDSAHLAIQDILRQAAGPGVSFTWQSNEAKPLEKSGPARFSSETAPVPRDLTVEPELIHLNLTVEPELTHLLRLHDTVDAERRAKPLLVPIVWGVAAAVTAMIVFTIIYVSLFDPYKGQEPDLRSDFLGPIDLIVSGSGNRVGNRRARGCEGRRFRSGV